MPFFSLPKQKNNLLAYLDQSDWERTMAYQYLQLRELNGLDKYAAYKTARLEVLRRAGAFPQYRPVRRFRRRIVGKYIANVPRDAGHGLTIVEEVSGVTLECGHMLQERYIRGSYNRLLGSSGPLECLQCGPVPRRER